MTYVITDDCVDVMDRSCLNECPVDCIYEGQRSMYIHPDECIDCGACETVCPMNAIVPDYDLADRQQPALERVQVLFAAIGSPQGARRYGRLPQDAAGLPLAQGA